MQHYGLDIPQLFVNLYYTAAIKASGSAAFAAKLTSLVLSLVCILWLDGKTLKIIETLRSTVVRMESRNLVKLLR